MWKKRQQGLMILQQSSIGDLPHITIFRCDFLAILLSFFLFKIRNWTLYNKWMQLENYQQEVHDMKNMSRQEYVAHLRR